MGKRDALIGIYANDLRERCGIEPEMELLRKVTIGTGPAIYDPQAAVVDAAPALAMPDPRRQAGGEHRGGQRAVGEPGRDM